MMNDTIELTPAGDGKPRTIMVVDPDVLVRMVIAEYLRNCGYRVIEAASAVDAFTLLENGISVDTIFSEIRLPGGVDGFSLAQQVRERYPHVDVMLTSGAAKAAAKAGELCDDGPLEKPYHPQDVMRLINVLRERRRTSPSGGDVPGGA
jgi:CheY-like chemotaxis protein